MQEGSPQPNFTSNRLEHVLNRIKLHVPELHPRNALVVLGLLTGLSLVGCGPEKPVIPPTSTPDQIPPTTLPTPRATDTSSLFPSPTIHVDLPASATATLIPSPSPEPPSPTPIPEATVEKSDGKRTDMMVGKINYGALEKGPKTVLTFQKTEPGATDKPITIISYPRILNGNDKDPAGEPTDKDGHPNKDNPVFVNRLSVTDKIGIIVQTSHSGDSAKTQEPMFGEQARMAFQVLVKGLQEYLIPYKDEVARLDQYTNGPASIEQEQPDGKTTVKEPGKIIGIVHMQPLQAEAYDKATEKAYQDYLVDPENYTPANMLDFTDFAIRFPKLKLDPKNTVAYVICERPDAGEISRVGEPEWIQGKDFIMFQRDKN